MKAFIPGFIAGVLILSLLVTANIDTMNLFGQKGLSPSSSSTITKANGTKTIVPTVTTTPSMLGLKITSPTRGQQVTIGEKLTVTGISSDNVATSCQVSVILNGVKPYQTAIPTGTKGQKDYSKWSYTFSHTSAIIKGGLNKITAKLSCPGSNTNVDTGTNPTADAPAKWYSVNFTGVNVSNNSNNNNNSQQPLSPPSSSPSPSKTQAATILPNQNSQGSSMQSKIAPSSITTTSQNHPITPAAKNLVSSSKPKTVNNNNAPNILKPLSVILNVARNPITVGDKQIIIVNVFDSSNGANSIKRISAAKVVGQITDLLSTQVFQSSFSSASAPDSSYSSSPNSMTHSPIQQYFSGVTDLEGKVLFSQKIPSGSSASIASADAVQATYQVKVKVSADGFKDKFAITSFQVKPVSFPNMNNIPSSLSSSSSNAVGGSGDDSNEQHENGPGDGHSDNGKKIGHQIGKGNKHNGKG
jgi:hypothetical protein